MLVSGHGKLSEWRRREEQQEEMQGNESGSGVGPSRPPSTLCLLSLSNSETLVTVVRAMTCISGLAVIGTIHCRK